MSDEPKEMTELAKVKAEIERRHALICGDGDYARGSREAYEGLHDYIRRLRGEPSPDTRMWEPEAKAARLREEEKRCIAFLTERGYSCTPRSEARSHTSNVSSVCFFEPQCIPCEVRKGRRRIKSFVMKADKILLVIKDGVAIGRYNLTKMGIADKVNSYEELQTLFGEIYYDYAFMNFGREH